MNAKPRPYTHREFALVGSEGVVRVVDHHGFGDNAADSVQDFAGTTDIERGGKQDHVAEGVADGSFPNSTVPTRVP